jgi:flagellar biosynthesis component FlhA
MPARIQLSLANALLPEGENTPGLRWILDDGLGAMRRAIQEAYGVVVPRVVLDADPTLDPDSYRIVIDQHLVKTAPAASHAPHRTIVLRLQAELVRWLHRFVGLTDLPEHLRRWAGDSPERNELIRRVLGSDEVLQRTAYVTVALIRESIPIRDLDTILGVILSADGRLSGDPLVELVRSALRDVIPGADGRRYLIELPGEVETGLRSGLRRDHTGSIVVLPREMARQLFEIMVGSLDDRDPATHAFVVRDPELRLPVRRIVARMSADLAVLAERDLP